MNHNALPTTSEQSTKVELISCHDLELIGRVFRDQLNPQEIQRTQEIIGQPWTGRQLGEAYAKQLEKELTVASDTQPETEGFYVLDGVEILLKTSLNEDPRDNRLSGTYMNERRQFVEAIIDHAKTMPRGEKTGEFANRFYGDFCDISPGALDYIGGVNDMFKLASKIATVPEFMHIHESMVGSMIYELSFVKSPNDFAQYIANFFQQQTTAEQLATIRTMRQIAKSAPGNGDFALSSVQLIQDAVSEIKDSKLTGLVNATVGILKDECQYIIETQDFYPPTRHRDLSLSIDLGDTYPNHRPSKIAPGVIGIRDPWGTMTMIAEVDEKSLPTNIQDPGPILMLSKFLRTPKFFEGSDELIRKYLVDIGFDSIKYQALFDAIPKNMNNHEQRSFFANNLDLIAQNIQTNRPQKVKVEPISTADYLKKIGIDASHEQIELFKEIHHPDIKLYLEKALGDLDLDKFNLETQFRLLTFAGQVKPAQFERFLKVTNGLNSSEKDQFINSFLALEHGSDMGEMILNITEKGEQEFILGTLEFIRTTAPLFAKIFEGHSKEFADQTHNSIIRRVTTSFLASANAYLENPESAKTTLYNGEEIKINNFYEISNAMSQLQTAFLLITRSFSDRGLRESTVIRNEEHSAGAVIDNTPDDPGVITVQVREYGVPYGDHNKDIEFDGEARINFLISLMNYSPGPGGSFAPSEYLSDSSRTEALSIRIDREGLIIDPAGKITTRDPTMQNATVSLDIGGYDSSQQYNINTLIAKILAIGDGILATKRGVNPSYHHMKELYSPQFGETEEFAKLARWVRHQFGADFHN